jgi:ADP-glucose pyrophosphorylase
MGKVLAFVLAGGRSENLGVLTKHRTMAAMPFGGRYRIIDFTLSNCVNSRVHTVQIATQYSPHSLLHHLQQGARGISTGGTAASGCCSRTRGAPTPIGIAARRTPCTRTST